MVNHSALCRSIKYDCINILTWTILKKIQILNGCETFAFKYIKTFFVLMDYHKYSDTINVELLSFVS